MKTKEEAQKEIQFWHDMAMSPPLPQAIIITPIEEQIITSSISQTKGRFVFYKIYKGKNRPSYIPHKQQISVSYSI